MSKTQVLQFYKALMRNIRTKLDHSQQSYYYYNVKQHFVSHKSEEQERVEAILERSEKDALWVLAKYLPESEQPKSIYDIFSLPSSRRIES
mmetsp:Transcript_22251/g.33106  ORF Transcript_22251/g.33106 Transcript_22251/m.33106 type:complete len:91 (+) Transcript_22251:96-368(+)